MHCKWFIHSDNNINIINKYRLKSTPVGPNRAAIRAFNLHTVHLYTSYVIVSLVYRVKMNYMKPFTYNNRLKCKDTDNDIMLRKVIKESHIIANKKYSNINKGYKISKRISFSFCLSFFNIVSKPIVTQYL